jgi:predicted DNA-binding ribbon-helix-helix protein
LEGIVKSLVIKHSVVIDNHKTSVSLEDAFWNALRDIAHQRDETLSHLVTGVDASRQSTNLSSAIRVFILEFYKDQLAQPSQAKPSQAKPSQAFQQREIPVQ